MDDAFRDILTVTIPIPYDEPRHQGIYSNTTSESKIVYCRINQFDNLLIEKICKSLNLKPATFFRFCAIRAAQELERHQDAYLASSKRP